MSTLREILNHRRAVRHFDPEQPLDTNKVKECIELATMAPTSSNMQLWECYHITNKEIIQQLSYACLGQLTATSAQQMVVFVTRQDKYKAHAKSVLTFERENIRRNYPPEKHNKYINRVEAYYNKLMPLLYSRGFGLLGLLRKILATSIGFFRPIVHEVSEADVRVVVHKSCALAVENFMLAMSEAGYDTCPLEGFDSKRVKRILHLPSNTDINMIITCGIRLPDGIRGDRFRLPFDEYYKAIN